jgi:TonB family protein
LTVLTALAVLISAPPLRGDWLAVQIEEPVYPALALQAGIAGTVRLRIVLDGHGGVDSVKVVSGPAVLAGAAQDNIKKWVFRACGEGDVAKAASTIEFTYVFLLEGRISETPRARFRYEHPYRVTLSSEQQQWMPSKAARNGR